MFVVGLEHDNYEENLTLAKTLNEKIKKLAPTLSRGVLEKKGPGVNGISSYSPFNRTLNCFTIEKNCLFKKLLTISFIIFMGLYISSESGFYEAKLSNKVALTDKAIKEFENDVIEGKTVDVNTYISNKNVDYSNKFTSSGERLSEALTKILT